MRRPARPPGIPQRDHQAAEPARVELVASAPGPFELGAAGGAVKVEIV